MRRARRLACETDELFEHMRKLRDLTADDVQDIVRDWFAGVVTSAEVAQRAAGQKTRQEVRDRSERNRATVAELRDALAANDFEPVAALADKLIAESGLRAEAGSPEDHQLRQLLLRGAIAAAQTLEARAAGDFSYEPGDAVFHGATASSSRAKTPLFSEAFSKYSEQRVHAGAWRLEMVRLNEDAKRLVISALGDKRVDRYARTDLAAWVGTLQKMPAMRGKTPELSGKSVDQLVAAAEKGNLKRLSPATIKKHANAISSFFSWAVSQGHRSDNPAKGIYKFRRTAHRSEERRAWSLKQLHELFGSPAYQGAKSGWSRAKPGNVVVQDYHWWLPVLGLYHPLRLEEIAQLRVSDIGLENGVLFFDVRGDDADSVQAGEVGRKVKSAAARRRVPVHDVALELGFGEYVESRRANGKMMLWDLEPGGQGNRYGFTFTKWFARYRDAIGIKDVDFHSFRHNSITALQAAGISPDIINRLDGHEIPGERGRYTKALRIAQLKTAIDSIRYEGITAKTIRKQVS